jgi:hypothetical protein
MRKNFANSKSGATVVSATSGIESKGSILDANDETYLILPDCSNTKLDSKGDPTSQYEHVVINLSDDVEVDTILISNNEDFSANLKEILFYGASDFPPADNKWINIGSIKPS